MLKKDSYKSEINACHIDDLLQDNNFISSQLHPIKESDEFWSKKIEEGAVDPEEYAFSRLFIQSVQVRQEFISDSDILNLWVNIEATNKKNIRMKKKRFQILSVVCGSAAIFVFLFLLKTIIPVKENNNNFFVFKNEPLRDTSTDVQLHLADNKTVPLDGEEVKISYNEEDIEINDNITVLKNDSLTGKKQEFHELVVPWGKRSILTLSEGSRMWINAGTRVAYPVPFDKKKREIFVDGEIYVEVSPEKDRPFIVKTGKVDVEVLGTTFNVMAYEKDTIQNIVLVSGSVKIHNNYQKKTIMMAPNEMYSFSEGFSKISTVDVEDYISWRTGIYRYRSEYLGEILKCLSHYYGCSINCSPQSAQMKFSGKLNLKDKLETILDGITQSAPVTYRYNNGVYIISNR